MKNWLLLALLLGLVLGCQKAVVNFGEESLSDDPNIRYIDTFDLQLSTFQLDSFITSGDTIFMVGSHKDNEFGLYQAQSYLQLYIPQSNPIKSCSNCVFDSLSFITKFTGSYYGDTTAPFLLNVHLLNEEIVADETSVGYNTSAIAFDPNPIGFKTFQNIAPYTKQQTTIKLADTLGQHLFDMLKRNSDTISLYYKFQGYLKGLVLTGAADNSKSIYYFNLYSDSNYSAMRLYYRVNGVSPTQQYVDFPISSPSYQFNTFSYDKSNTPLAVFLPKKKQLLPSSQTDNKVYLHNNSGLYPHIKMPDFFALKELHPYIKVVKAVLEITPPSANYDDNSLYKLPENLMLFGITEDLVISNYLTTSEGAVLYGDLSIDNLYHKDTKYTYDITSYVNSVLSVGRTSNLPLLLYSGSKQEESRLILDASKSNSSVKLKLYVLGL